MHIAPLLVASILALPPAEVGPPRQRAEAYFRDGEKEFQKERYEQALKDFEMVLMLTRFSYGDEILIGESLRMATTSALRVGDRNTAIRLGRKSLAWAREYGDPSSTAHAANNLLEARLLGGSFERQTAALVDAEQAVESADDPVERERLERLRARLLESQAGSSPGDSPPETDDGEDG